MENKMYFKGGIYRLDNEKGKGKIYKIINKSTPKCIDKLFSDKSFADAQTGTYYFYISDYCLQLSWSLGEIYDFLELIEATVLERKNLLQTIDDEGFYFYIVTMPLKNNDIRLVILDRKEDNCRDWQTRYADPYLTSTVAALDIVIKREDFIKQCYEEFTRIYEENKYYISEEYEKECEKEGAILCQEYVLKSIYETSQLLKLKGNKLCTDMI